MRRIATGLVMAMGILAMETGLSASSPRPELMDYDAIHPLCVAHDAHVDTETARRFCAAVTAALAKRGRDRVETVPMGDARLGQPRHIVLGFTLARSEGGLTISALLSRVDRPSGALLPPAAELLPAAPDAAALATAAARLVAGLGL